MPVNTPTLASPRLSQEREDSSRLQLAQMQSRYRGLVEAAPTPWSWSTPAARLCS
jgi:hypothetical protein